MSPDKGQPGNGLLLFFRVDDFDMALALRDPDGYYVMVSAVA